MDFSRSLRFEELLMARGVQIATKVSFRLALDTANSDKSDGFNPAYRLSAQNRSGEV